MNVYLQYMIALAAHMNEAQHTMTILYCTTRSQSHIVLCLSGMPAAGTTSTFEHDLHRGVDWHSATAISFSGATNFGRDACDECQA
jgi:hypothetical protein